jgi:hypothetical protein
MVCKGWFWFDFGQIVHTKSDFGSISGQFCKGNGLQKVILQNDSGPGFMPVLESIWLQK